MDRLLLDSSVVVATKDHVSCPLGDDIIILDLKAGLYFSLDNVGARIWQLIQQPRAIQELRTAILDEFEVAQDACERDLLALVTDLAARGLIDVRDAAAV